MWIGLVLLKIKILLFVKDVEMIKTQKDVCFLSYRNVTLYLADTFT